MKKASFTLLMQIRFPIHSRHINIRTTLDLPPQRSSQTVKRAVLLAKLRQHGAALHDDGLRDHDDEDTIQMMTYMRVPGPLGCAFLNIRGWQIAYHRSKAMQLKVRRLHRHRHGLKREGG